MKTQYTPGPWFAVQYANCFDIQSEEGYCLNNILDWEQDDNAEANARLISAAPELLEVLIKVKNAASKMLTVEMVDLDNALCEAIDIIAKATGETITSNQNQQS